MIVKTIVQPEFEDLENFNFKRDYQDTHEWLSQFNHYHAINTLKQLEIKYKKWRDYVGTRNTNERNELVDNNSNSNFSNY